MKKDKIFILFDGVLEEYKNHYGKEGESKLVADLKHYLSDLSKKAEIIIITNENILKMTTWFLENDLYNFIENITNPAIRGWKLG